MNLIVAFVLLACVACVQQSSCQDADLRNGNDKTNVEGGAQSRTIYSQRTLSPHRMMHFGKRPEVQAPPTVPISMQGVYDLYQPSTGFSRFQRSIASASPIAEKTRPMDETVFPYLFSIDIGRGQTLQALPDIPVLPLQHQQNQMYNYDHVIDPNAFILSEPEQNLLAQQQGARFDAAKFMRLMTNDKTDGLIESNKQDNEGANQANADSQQQQQQQQQQQSGEEQPAINVSSRSIRGNTLTIPKAFISTLMGHGRQGAGMSQGSMGSFGFNKKAEPKNNLFMHFGRK